MPQTARKKVTVKAKVKVAPKKAVKPVAKAAVKKTAVKAPAKKLVAATKPATKMAPKSSAKKAPVKAVAKAPLKAAPKAIGKAIVKPAPKAVVPAPKMVAKPVAKVEVKAAPAPKAALAKSVYKVGVHVVYPTHGVGKIVAEETQMIGDVELRLLVISFEKDKMTLRVPVHRATAAGLRPVSSVDQMKKVFAALKGRARTSRGMWSRRAQEYEAKINSGNIFFIAEVVRDLHQNVDQSERSYSERMIYESALSRLVGELAAAEATDHKTATDKLMKLLRGKVAAAAAAAAVTKEAA